MFNPVLKGGFEYDLTGTVLTVASKGRTVVEFPKAAGGGKVCRLDLTGSKGIFSIDLAAYPVNMYCGISDAAWGTDYASGAPFFDFLVNTDDTAANVKLGVTRNPTLTVLPAHASLNFSDELASGGQAQTNVILNCAHDAALGAMPVVSIGSHRQYYTAGATDLWTVGAIGTTDGFGTFQEGVLFTFPEGQNGATAGSYFSEAGAATSLDFGSMTFLYQIHRNGNQEFWFNTGTRSAGDASATPIYIHTPYAFSSTAGAGIGRVLGVGKINNTLSTYYITTTTGASYMQQTDVNGVVVQVAHYANANDYIAQVHVIDKAF